MKPFKSFEIDWDTWKSGRKWAVPIGTIRNTIPREENYVHEYDDFMFFWTRQDAREWITWYKTRKNCIGCESESYFSWRNDNDEWIVEDFYCFRGTKQ